MSNDDLHWLSGLIEGEGCFSITPKQKYKDSEYRYPTVQLRMTDEDVVSRAARLLGANYFRLESNNPKHKATFEFKIIGSRAERIMILLAPLMGSRRSARINELLLMCQRKRSVKHDRAIRAFELRKEGMTFVEIGKALGGMVHTSAMRIVKIGESLSA